MQYQVNQNKKSALEQQAFRGNSAQVMQRGVCFAFMAFAVLFGEIMQILYRPGSALSMPAEQFALCMLLLGSSLLFYIYTLAAAYRRAKDISNRAQEALSLTDSLLCYSYVDARSRLKIEYRLPLSELRKVERHAQMALWRLTGEFELRISSPDFPDDEPAVTTLSHLMLGDYFDGTEDLFERLGCRTE